MVLQNTVRGDIRQGQSFHFAVDTCENFAQYTGNTECVKNEIVMPLLPKFSVFIKTSYLFYSTETYILNDNTLTSFFSTTFQPLSST